MNNVTPTPKQIAVVKNLQESTGSMKELLIKSGYSPETAETPSQVLNSRGVQKLRESAEKVGLTDEICLKRLREAVESRNLELAVRTSINWFRIKYPTERNETTINNTQNNVTFKWGDDGDNNPVHTSATPEDMAQQ